MVGRLLAKYPSNGATHATVARIMPSHTIISIEPQEHAMLTEAITTAPPVLAAGWAFLYLLFGGGFGGAILIFFGLKLIGR
jgi:hypothetical protein